MFNTRRPLRHHDRSRYFQLARRVRDALGVIPRRAGHDALPADFRVEMRHLVVGAAQLKAEDWLQVFAFEQDAAFEAVGEVDGGG